MQPIFGSSRNALLPLALRDEPNNGGVGDYLRLVINFSSLHWWCKCTVYIYVRLDFWCSLESSLCSSLGRDGGGVWAHSREQQLVIKLTFMLDVCLAVFVHNSRYQESHPSMQKLSAKWRHLRWIFPRACTFQRKIELHFSYVIRWHFELPSLVDPTP